MNDEWDTDSWDWKQIGLSTLGGIVAGALSSISPFNFNSVTIGDRDEADRFSNDSYNRRIASFGLPLRNVLRLHFFLEKPDRDQAGKISEDSGFSKHKMGFS